MRVHVVSDVHGNVSDLKRAGDGADALIVLGDLIDFVDYHDPRRGILGQVFGAEASRRFAHLRAVGGPGELGSYLQSLWNRFDDPGPMVERAVREQYAEMFAALRVPTYATPGNVDMPHLWTEFAGDGVTVVAGEVVEIGGLRFGFVGGAPLPPGVVPRRTGPWHPYVRAAEEFGAATAALRDVDVLCSHIPPDVAELAYDTAARRFEASSAELLEIIGRDRPAAALFGHVHQPLSGRRRLGRTECVNVGHFARTGTPFVWSW